jgi:hypothetical protein
MSIRFVSNKKIAETSSKGNQEKWYEASTSTWYKLDQFGYEALAETVASRILELSNIESDTPFTFVRYSMERLHVHGRERTGCASANFLKHDESIITVNRLLSSHLGIPLKEKLGQLPSDKKRIEYLAEATAEYTGLKHFPEYLTLLFEIDALICNDDRHLNNIAVIERNGKYDYCPIFDNGAGFLSNTQISRMDITPSALIHVLRAQPIDTTFTRQMNAARKLYRPQLYLPKLTAQEIHELLDPTLSYYAQRDRSIIADRVVNCILIRQKNL